MHNTEVCDMIFIDYFEFYSNLKTVLYMNILKYSNHCFKVYNLRKVPSA